MMIAGSIIVEAGELHTNWKLTDLYPDVEAWRAAREELPRAIEELQKYQGKLDQGPEKLLAALEIASKVTRQASRIAIYANLLSDLDTRDPGPQGMKQANFQQLAELRAKASWIDPEILAMPSALIQEYLEQEPGLAPYRRTLEKLEKKRQHTLDSSGEQILSLTGLLRGDTANIGSLLLNAELPWQTITLSDGAELKVNVPGYARGRARDNRDDRIKTYEAFYGQLAAFQQVLATTVAATMKSHHFTAKVRSYDDTRQASLAGDEVDPAVYDMLVEETNRALPTLHRYLQLRARMLGLDDLAYHDLYPALVGNVEADYSWPRTVEVVLESFAPMGEEYVNYLRHACESGWIDVYPREGKRSGAYMSGRAYDVHPYMLLNHLDDYDSASTFAHEAGHMMHSAYSNKTQPFPTSGYETFVAEVASTTQEWLFFKYSLEHATSDDERLVILGNFLESFRTTVFRQTMFAEFELQAHRLVEQGQPVTSESLNALYLDLLKRYHGHDQGVCRIDDAYQVEWAFVPHFHLDYYVYTYATSFIAATACSEQIMTGENGGVERYIDNLLKAGSSRPPVQLLSDAGVDMTTPAPFRAAFAAMNEIIDQIEEILDRQS
jgi:oligoendopeptidase F